MKAFRWICAFVIVFASLMFIVPLAGVNASPNDNLNMPGFPPVRSAYTLNPEMPASPVKLIFIHHSTGQNWLADGYGNLGIGLRDNNYYVSDTNYGWGPDGIGNFTDLGHWWNWFRGINSGSYLSALYSEFGQTFSFSRLNTDPGGANEIIIFKSCFPNSNLGGSLSDPIPSIDSNPMKGKGAGDSSYTVSNAKGIYIDLLEYFKTRQDKLFIVITAPPLINSINPANVRAFNQWLVYDWLANYPYHNVAVFDFYNVLTGPDNHHYYLNGKIEHLISNQNNSYYPSNSSDDHPNPAGSQKATADFTSFVNVTYHLWKDNPFQQVDCISHRCSFIPTVIR